MILSPQWIKLGEKLPSLVPQVGEKSPMSLCLPRLVGELGKRTELSAVGLDIINLYLFVTLDIVLNLSKLSLLIFKIEMLLPASREEDSGTCTHLFTSSFSVILHRLSTSSLPCTVQGIGYSKNKTAQRPCPYEF